MKGLPIGIFDSGYGGLTIYSSIRERLPQYDYVYLGDNARSPYGSRSFEMVYKFTAEAVRYLFARGCRLVIIACNTASAKALRTLQQQLLPREFPDRRVLGIIRPCVERFEEFSETGSVALWATEGTVKSLTYPIEVEKYAPHVRLVQQACPMLVPLVENGEIQNEATDFFIRKYWDLTAAQSPDADALLLACTHYPILLPRIRAIVPERVRIITQGAIVAPSLENYLNRHPEVEGDLSRFGSQHFLTTDRTEGFDRLAEIFLGHAVRSEKVEID